MKDSTSLLLWTCLGREFLMPNIHEETREVTWHPLKVVEACSGLLSFVFASWGIRIITASPSLGGCAGSQEGNGNFAAIDLHFSFLRSLSVMPPRKTTVSSLSVNFPFLVTGASLSDSDSDVVWRRRPFTSGGRVAVTRVVPLVFN